MKIRSNIITREDVWATVGTLREHGVYVDDDGIRSFTPRAGGNGFELFLEGYGPQHRRARNGRDGHAATWTEYGIWFALLFKLDPEARIAWYDGVGAFLDSTATAYGKTDAETPWLADPELARLAA